MGWEKPDVLYIYYELIDNIFQFIPIEKTKIESIIGKYVENKYNLEVRETLSVYGLDGKLS